MTHRWKKFTPQRCEDSFLSKHLACAVQHKAILWVCLTSFTMKPVKIIIRQEALAFPWLLGSPQIIFDPLRSQKPLSCVPPTPHPPQTRHLAFLTTTRQAAPQASWCCLLTLLPSLPGPPGWPGTPDNPCRKNMHHCDLGATFLRVWQGEETNKQTKILTDVCATCSQQFPAAAANVQ